MNSQNLNTEDMGLNMDFGMDFAPAGSGVPGDDQYTMIPQQQDNGNWSFDNQTVVGQPVVMGNSGEITIDPALLALGGPGERTGATAGTPAFFDQTQQIQEMQQTHQVQQVQQAEASSYWNHLPGVNENFSLNAPRQGVYGDPDDLVSPHTTGPYFLNQTNEIEDTILNVLGPTVNNDPGFAADVNMDLEGDPNFVTFRDGYTAGYEAAQKELNTTNGKSAIGKSPRRSTRAAHRAAPYTIPHSPSAVSPSASSPSNPLNTPAFATDEEVPLDVVDIVSRLLSPPREATDKSGKLKRTWFVETFPEHFPQYGGYRLRKKSPLWKYGPQALGIPERYWQWLNGGLVHYTNQELLSELMELAGMAPAQDVVQQADPTAAAASVPAKQGEFPKSHLPVPSDLQRIVQAIMSPPSEAIWHGTGKLKRDWLMHQFPEHFRKNDRHLKPQSALREYGPEALGMPVELWRFLCGELGTFVVVGAEGVGRRGKGRKKD